MIIINKSIKLIISNKNEIFAIISSWVADYSFEGLLCQTCHKQLSESLCFTNTKFQPQEFV